MAAAEEEVGPISLLSVNIRKWKISKATDRGDRGLCGRQRPEGLKQERQAAQTEPYLFHLKIQGKTEGNLSLGLPADYVILLLYVNLPYHMLLMSVLKSIFSFLK